MTAVQPTIRADRTLPPGHGRNPHQGTAFATEVPGRLPFQVLRGTPSYRTLLDALTAWQLVRDGRAVLHRPIAASFQHGSPNGVGIDVPLSDGESAAYQAPGDLSPIALAAVRARGTDRVAAHGDFVALSDEADESFAEAMRGEAIRGVLAPSFRPAALHALAGDRDGTPLLMTFDADAEPPRLARRELFGVQVCQERDQPPVTRQALVPVTRVAELPGTAVPDVLVACLAVRYAPSSAVCLAHRGQTVGIGAGQPAALRSVLLAGQRADAWLLRQHPAVLGIRFTGSLTRHDLDSAADEFVRWDGLPSSARRRLIRQSTRWLGPLTPPERDSWLGHRSGVAMACDGPVAGVDALHAAAAHGVRYLAHPGGSRHDTDIGIDTSIDTDVDTDSDTNSIACADELGLTMMTFGRQPYRH